MFNGRRKLVTAVETQGDGILTKKRIFAQVRFVDQSGTKHVAPLNENLKIGRKVQLAYHEDEPTKILNMQNAVTRDQALVSIGIGGLVTLLSVVCLLWPNSTVPSEKTENQEKTVNQEAPVSVKTNRSLSGLRGLGLAFFVAIVLGGMAIDRNQYKSVETTTIAEVVTASDLGQSTSGLFARYEDQTGVVCHAALDGEAAYKPGDRISYQYRAKSTGAARKIYARPWLQVAFLAICGIIGFAAFKSGTHAQPQR